MNLINYRKEFFKVTLEEIESKSKEFGSDVEFHRLAEAMEYRETIALIERMKLGNETKPVEQIVADEFPTSL